MLSWEPRHPRSPPDQEPQRGSVTRTALRQRIARDGTALRSGNLRVAVGFDSQGSTRQGSAPLGCMTGLLCGPVRRGPAVSHQRLPPVWLNHLQWQSVKSVHRGMKRRRRKDSRSADLLSPQLVACTQWVWLQAEQRNHERSGNERAMASGTIHNRVCLRRAAGSEPKRSGDSQPQAARRVSKARQSRAPGAFSLAEHDWPFGRRKGAIPSLT